MLTRTCLWDRLVAAWSVEIQSRLSDAVVRWWANAGRRGPPIPARSLANNAWELLDSRGAVLRKLVESIPPKAVLLIAGGSPCQQF
eukprot:12603419-Alexandrium_andersonii.AAC.1